MQSRISTNYMKRKGIEETKKLFPELKSKIKIALDHVEQQLVGRPMQ